jgi:hypothetical protein
MVNRFNTLLAASGLTQSEAADWFDTNKAQIVDWARGKSRVPDRVVNQIADLAERILGRADTLADQIQKLVNEHGLPKEIEIAISTDDHEAALNGLPTVSTERVCIGWALAQLAAETRARVKIVPRGSTVATAAAERARQT